jgi:hypothetical protein
MKFPHVLFFISLIIALAGCNPKNIYKPATVKFESLENWHTYYIQSLQQIHTIQSEARISIESSQLATNITIGLIFAAPDTLFLKAEGPFGLDLGKIFIGKDRFILYNQFNNQFFTGSLDDEYYNTFLETDFSFAELKYGLIGRAPLPWEAVLVDAERGVFERIRDNENWRYTVDKKSGNLASFEIEEGTNIVFRQEYLNYTHINGVKFPRFIKIILPQKKEMVAIYHKNIKINERLEKQRYSIEIGPKIKQIIIGNSH